MKRLGIYIKEYKKQAILAPLFKMSEAVMDLLVPLVVAAIINNGIAENNSGYVVRSFILLIVLAAVGLGLSITAQWFAARTSVGVAGNIRQALFAHIQKLSFKEIDTLGSDTLITRMTSDVNQIQNGLNLALRLLLRSPFIVFGAMIMAFTIDVKCALIFVVAIPVLSVVVFGIMLMSIPILKKVQKALDGLLGVTRENLTGVRVIRAFCREEESVKEFDEKNEAVTRLNEVAGRLSALMNPVTYVIINIAAIILINQGAIQVNLGNLQQGDVVALYNYMAQIIVELVKLASLIISINKALASASRIEQVFDVEPSIEYGTGSADEYYVAAADSVVFDNVSFTYVEGADAAVENLNFNVKKGQTVGIIGGTGSGKTTLVSLIMRFYDATKGNIYIDGRNIKEYSKEALTEKMGIVPQKAVLFEGSIRENLKWGNENATDEELLYAAEMAQALDVIENKGGLDAHIEQNGRNLSGGQKQRLTIARALVKNPSILILDDSASALDYATDLKLRKALATLSHNTTVFIVSQRASGIRHADQILVMDDGDLAGTGTHDELMKNCPVYQEIYYSQYPEERPSDGNKEKEVMA